MKKALRTLDLCPHPTPHTPATGVFANLESNSCDNPIFVNYPAASPWVTAVGAVTPSR